MKQKSELIKYRYTSRSAEVYRYFFALLRMCLKNHSHNLHASLCGIFCPNSVA